MNDIAKVLYYFQGESVRLFEIMRTDLPDTAPIEDRFFWFFQEGEANPVRLEFRGMERGELEKRSFDAGSFEFSRVGGRYDLFGRVGSVDAIAVDSLHSSVEKGLLKFLELKITNK